MKKVSAISLGIVLAGLLTAPVNAEQTDPAASSAGQPQVQADQGQPQQSGNKGNSSHAGPKDPSTSLDAQYKKRIEQKKRAAAMREQLLREGQEQTPPQQ
jgi:hypothetical protein